MKNLNVKVSPTGMFGEKDSKSPLHAVEMVIHHHGLEFFIAVEPSAKHTEEAPDYTIHNALSAAKSRALVKEVRDAQQTAQKPAAKPRRKAAQQQPQVAHLDQYAAKVASALDHLYGRDLQLLSSTTVELTNDAGEHAGFVLVSMVAANATEDFSKFSRDTYLHLDFTGLAIGEHDLIKNSNHLIILTVSEQIKLFVRDAFVRGLIDAAISPVLANYMQPRVVIPRRAFVYTAPKETA